MLSGTLKCLLSRFSLEKERDPNRSAIEHFQVQLSDWFSGSIRVSKSDIYQVSLLGAELFRLEIGWEFLSKTQFPEFATSEIPGRLRQIPSRPLWRMPEGGPPEFAIKYRYGSIDFQTRVSGLCCHRNPSLRLTRSFFSFRRVIFRLDYRILHER